ncbi:MAG: NAD(P)H-dependent oxidoreductase [Gemmatimonadota bacterium]|nr:MAG: NAD(P)H-dependent oxidoreductase [Gemmatimonadota bacterium]
MPPEKGGITIAVVIGSARVGNYTAKAVALVLDELRKIPDVSVEVVDPAGMELPLPGAGGPSADVQTVRAAIGGATGVILATPEYHGSFSSGAKLIIDNLGYPSELSGKPIALLGVAGGVIGAVKALEHLRSVCSHVGGIVLPGSCSVANVRKVFGEGGQCHDPMVEQRIRQLPTSLIEYIRRSVCPGESQEEAVRGETS